MNLRDLYNSKAIALRQTQVASNSKPYIGSVLFPNKKKMGLDLKWIKTSKGLPVSLMPSAFDAKSTIRSREGLDTAKTQMAFFRESMLVKEEDEQEIMRIQDSTDPYAQAVLDHIYDDANTLVEGAKVVPERMRMQLLAPEDGSPKINITANGVPYEYNYDPNGTFAANNFTQLLGTAMWSQTSTADPITDVMLAQDAIEEATGERPTYMLISKKTMTQLVKNEILRGYILAQNATANIFMNEARVKQVFADELGISIIVYTKQFKDEAGVAHKFFPDGFATLLPEGSLGNTWYGMTPEERTLAGSGVADVAIVEGGIAVAVTTTSDPVNTKTTVSEIVLPSFERMDSVYCIKADTAIEAVEGTVAEGSSSGTTKVTVSTTLGSGESLVVSTSATALPIYGQDLSSWTAYTSASNITVADGNTFYLAVVKDGLCMKAAAFTADTKA